MPSTSRAATAIASSAPKTVFPRPPRRVPPATRASRRVGRISVEHRTGPANRTRMRSYNPPDDRGCGGFGGRRYCAGLAKSVSGAGDRQLGGAVGGAAFGPGSDGGRADLSLRARGGSAGRRRASLRARQGGKFCRSGRGRPADAHGGVRHLRGLSPPAVSPRASAAQSDGGRGAGRGDGDGLEADALHFSTDVWSTLVVLLGMLTVWAGERLHAPWLAYADPIAALGVSAVILQVGARLSRRTLDALLDRAPEELRERIRQVVGAAEGVLDVHRLRVRRAGSRYFVDVTIAASHSLTLEQAHDLSDAVEQAVQLIVPADVMVHVEPRPALGEHLFDAIRGAARRSGLAVHEISAQQLDGRLFVDLHLEVDERLSLREAHRRASELEERIREHTGPESEINIHIEPLGMQIRDARSVDELTRAIEAHLESIRSRFPELTDCHQVRVRTVEHRILVSCHCSMNGDLPVTRAHDITVELEQSLRRAFPDIDRITIHPEPAGES